MTNLVIVLIYLKKYERDNEDYINLNFRSTYTTVSISRLIMKLKLTLIILLGLI